MLKVPLPLTMLHVPVLAPPPMDAPLSVMATGGLLSQISKFAPASTVGIACTIRLTVINESQPLYAGSVKLYVPDAEVLLPSGKVYVLSLQMVSLRISGVGVPGAGCMVKLDDGERHVLSDINLAVMKWLPGAIDGKVTELWKAPPSRLYTISAPNGVVTFTAPVALVQVGCVIDKVGVAGAVGTGLITKLTGAAMQALLLVFLTTIL